LTKHLCFGRFMRLAQVGPLDLFNLFNSLHLLQKEVIIVCHIGLIGILRWNKC
jgi:hypothetical protein